MQKTTIFHGLEVVMLMATLVLSACGGGGAGSGTGTTSTTSTTSSSGSGGTGGGTATATYILSWDPVSAPSMSGYRVYYGTAPLASQSPLGAVDTTVTSIEFSPAQYKIATGTTLYMAVSTLGSNGVESPTSKVVSIVVQ